MTRRHGHISEQIETLDNFESALYHASRRKKRRWEVKRFEKDKPENLQHLLSLYQDEQYRVTGYKYKVIYEPKRRFLGMLDFPHHVFQWGLLLPTESLIKRRFDYSTWACIEGKGQHSMVRRISADIRSDGSNKLFYLSIDTAKMYASIPLSLPKQNIRRIIKDPKFLRTYDRILDSTIGTPMGNPDAITPTGVPIGLKLSTVTANLSFMYLDHDVRCCFRVLESPATFDFYVKEYIEGKRKTAKTDEERNEVAKGDDYLRSKFRGYLTNVQYYYRFMDNIFILHEDKTFLHILFTWIAFYMASEMRLTLNDNWCIRPLTEGMPIVGYRIFEDGHRLSGKKAKKELIDHINYGRDVLHLSYKQIFHALSSRIGHFMHANAINLLTKYNMIMETHKPRLGDKIKAKRSPFEGNPKKVQFEKILYDTREGEIQDEDSKLIELQDYIIDDSVIEHKDDGTPKKRIVLLYRWLGEPFDNIEKGDLCYSYSGSQVLIEQAQEEFTKEDLPCNAVIKVFINKQKKKFYKFT